MRGKAWRPSGGFMQKASGRPFSFNSLVRQTWRETRSSWSTALRWCLDMQARKWPITSATRKKSQPGGSCGSYWPKLRRFDKLSLLRSLSHFERLVNFWSLRPSQISRSKYSGGPWLQHIRKYCWTTSTFGHLHKNSNWINASLINNAMTIHRNNTGNSRQITFISFIMWFNLK